jgi:lipid A ethanolaminephosphotransferase
VLQDCPAQHIVNAYDNALRYTDLLLGQTVAWLKTQQRPTALIYLSDHGESLGEKGLYLHGMPFVMAPQEQTHVPMALWLSQPMQARLGWDNTCWKKQASLPVTHDHFFYSVLTLAQVKTRLHQPALDLLDACATTARQGP